MTLFLSVVVVALSVLVVALIAGRLMKRVSARYDEQPYDSERGIW